MIWPHQNLHSVRFQIIITLSATNNILIFSEQTTSLLPLFSKDYSEEKKSEQLIKEENWLKHFADYGRGISFYRTTELYELIFDGLPDNFRCELWLIFSGAIHQVNRP